MNKIELKKLKELKILVALSLLLKKVNDILKYMNVMTLVIMVTNEFALTIKIVVLLRNRLVMMHFIDSLKACMKINYRDCIRKNNLKSQLKEHMGKEIQN